MAYPSNDVSIQFSRYHIRMMRTMIAANNRMIESYEVHNSQLQMMIDTLEREITRGDIHDTLRVSPYLAPPVLRRQTNVDRYPVSYSRSHDRINNQPEESN